MTPSTRIVQNAMKSTVIISIRGQTGSYCCGFIPARARLQDRGTSVTLVIAPTDFVRGRERDIMVCFFDGVQLPASVVATEKYFCLLKTDVHPRCKEYSPVDSEIRCSPTFILGPTSSTSSILVSSDVTAESLKSYLWDDVEEMVVDSEQFFVVATPDYIRRNTSTGLDRLSGALVFTQSGRAIGVVLQDCRELDMKGMKVAVGTVYIKKLLSRLLPKLSTSRKKRAPKTRDRKQGLERERGLKRKRGPESKKAPKKRRV